MKFFISPNFTHEKLENPGYQDLVDVFEDRVRNWFLSPASILLKHPHGEWAAVGILLNYFEAIEIYHKGEDSNCKSRNFFSSGFQRVFCSDLDDKSYIAAIAMELYDEARCGFAHEALFRRKVIFHSKRPSPIEVTWRRENGKFVKDEQPQSVVICPSKFYESIEEHFSRYVGKLRSAEDGALVSAFKEAVRLKWALEGPAPIVGMTEQEFDLG